MTTNAQDDKKQLRKFLNPSIRGTNIDILLESIATGTSYLVNTVEAVNDSLYIVSASGKYLDQRMADRNLTRPDNVGLSDDVFRQIGLEITNRKQVRDLVLKILDIMYGSEFTRATSRSTTYAPYNLEDGDTLMIQFDDGEILEVAFLEDQFTNISSATALEVADSITKNLRKLGKEGLAFAGDDGLGSYVTLMSNTIGPSSSVTVRGGKSQNQFRFNKIRPTSADSTTQWKLEQISGGKIRATWINGSNPSIGKVGQGDYVAIYGGNFNILNRGTFNILKSQGGVINEAYFEFENINGISETITQGTDDAILFYQPERSSINSKITFATAYQTKQRILEIFMPATTKIVRRERIGAAYLHDGGAATENDLGPYIFEKNRPFLIGSEECHLTTKLDFSSSKIIDVDDSSSFPDKQGFLILGFGTSHEEGPVPYISKPSNNTLLISPAYKLKYEHEVGTSISLVSQNYSYTQKTLGSDYGFYITSTISGRLYCENLIRSVIASGITVVFYILYPSDVGLGKSGSEEYSEKYYVWGE